MSKVSVIIPSYKDPYLHRMIDSLLDNSDGDIEIIPVLDGYDADFKYDSRIKPVRLKETGGMRNAINVGVSRATGKFIMRTDEHCKFGKGFDGILVKNIEPNWIVTPRRYQLNPETWEEFGDPIDYEKMIIGVSVIGGKKGVKKFHAAKCDGVGDIGEKTAMQGSCWLMYKSWWDKVIKGLDSEGYGPLYQDSTEMLFKTWQAGGKLMLNRNTWYAHKSKEFKRTHSYPTAEAYKSFTYAINTWKDYYDKWIKYRL